MRCFTEFDSYLFHEGTNYETYKKMGAHLTEEDGQKGTRFVVWAPHAGRVNVITAKTGWENEIPMEKDNDSGVYEVFVPGVEDGDAYRYRIECADGIWRGKSDPYAFRSELRPANASIVSDLNSYEWGDEAYQSKRDNKTVVEKPMAIYEVHPGSWKKGFRDENDEDGFLNYRQIADDLAEYVTYMGYTHVG